MKPTGRSVASDVFAEAFPIDRTQAKNSLHFGTALLSVMLDGPTQRVDKDHVHRQHSHLLVFRSAITNDFDARWVADFEALDSESGVGPGCQQFRDQPAQQWRLLCNRFISANEQIIGYIKSAEVDTKLKTGMAYSVNVPSATF